jgi:CBS domain containing-hemolysin-like protein
LPRPGDRVPTGAQTFEIVEMEGRRVKTVRVLLEGQVGGEAAGA